MKLAISYWTNTGNTQEMAEAIEQGAKEAGAETELCMIDELEDPETCDVIAMGCPAMGNEELDGIFRGYYSQLKPELKGKKVALFGSWGWGNGAYMDAWKKDCQDAGMVLIAEPMLCQKKPDEAGLNACRQFGRKLAEAK